MWREPCRVRVASLRAGSPPRTPARWGAVARPTQMKSAARCRIGSTCRCGSGDSGGGDMAARRVASVVGVALLAAAPLAAHHGFSSEYDENKPVTLTGPVTKVEWTNPHARFYIDVKDASGKVENWNFEMASPNVLSRNGWRKDTLKIGSVITVGGYLARQGERMAIAGALTGPDGKPLFASTQQDLGK